MTFSKYGIYIQVISNCHLKMDMNFFGTPCICDIWILIFCTRHCFPPFFPLRFPLLLFLFPLPLSSLNSHRFVPHFLFTHFPPSFIIASLVLLFGLPGKCSAPLPLNPAYLRHWEYFWHMNLNLNSENNIPTLSKQIFIPPTS